VAGRTRGGIAILRRSVAVVHDAHQWCWTKHGIWLPIRWRHGSFDLLSGSGFSNTWKTEPNQVASGGDGTSIGRPHCSIGFCHSRCGSRTPAYHGTEWQSPCDLSGHYPAAVRRLQCAHGGRSRPPRGNSNADILPNLCVAAEMSAVGGSGLSGFRRADGKPVIQRTAAGDNVADSFRQA
jgi:hypothetical protein